MKINLLQFKFEIPATAVEPLKIAARWTLSSSRSPTRWRHFAAVSKILCMESSPLIWVLCDADKKSNKKHFWQSPITVPNNSLSPARSHHPLPAILPVAGIPPRRRAPRADPALSRPLELGHVLPEHVPRPQGGDEVVELALVAVLQAEALVDGGEDALAAVLPLQREFLEVGLLPGPLLLLLLPPARVLVVLARLRQRGEEGVEDAEELVRLGVGRVLAEEPDGALEARLKGTRGDF